MMALRSLRLIALVQCIYCGYSLFQRPTNPDDLSLYDSDETYSAPHPLECCGPDGTWVEQTKMNGYLRVWPEKKFAFCAIPKNAHFEFLTMMNHVNGISDQFQIGDARWWTQAVWDERNVSLGEMTKANGWRFGVFLRDPAERFLSAWSSKCVRKSNGYWEDGGINCLGGLEQIVDGQQVDLINAFERAATLLPAYMKTSGTTTPGHNAHWDPQALFCDLLPLADYDFIGHLSGDANSVYSQVKQMFKHTAKVPSKHPTFWQALNDRFSQHVDGGWVEHNSHALTKMQTFYRSPDTYELVKRAYDIDYKKLPLKPGHYE